MDAPAAQVIIRYRKEAVIDCPVLGCSGTIEHSLDDPVNQPAPGVGETVTCPLCQHKLLIIREEAY